VPSGRVIGESFKGGDIPCFKDAEQRTSSQQRESERGAAGSPQKKVVMNPHTEACRQGGLGVKASGRYRGSSKGLVVTTPRRLRGLRKRNNTDPTPSKRRPPGRRCIDLENCGKLAPGEYQRGGTPFYVLSISAGSVDIGQWPGTADRTGGPRAEEKVDPR